MIEMKLGFKGRSGLSFGAERLITWFSVIDVFLIWGPKPFVLFRYWNGTAGAIKLSKLKKPIASEERAPGNGRQCPIQQ